MSIEPIGLFGGCTELVEKLEDMGRELAEESFQPHLFEIDGENFFYDYKNQRFVHIERVLPKDDPFPSPLRFFTLDGIVEYITSNVEGIVPPSHVTDGQRLILHVVDHLHVCLLSKISENEKKRYPIAFCEARPPEIAFGRHLDVERFNTMLLSTFVQTDALAEVFKMTKSMVKEQGMQTADDGVSQQITVKAGITLASTSTFQNPVPLQPIRTFTEIEQPVSNFTLRVNNDAECALFESDGGAWKSEAVRRIRDYLLNRLSAYSVVVLA